ncbi:MULTISPECIES: SGNH/GDSL hydrolase family protein [unclassified Coleofasciculus]|uniref:SGNH/GDSL hydrolase family protein n=1 Tax=unclassified Coleofasciculus TaxID=2692782 RepID=UPI001D13D4BF|nr:MULTISPECIES: GDSL-type esterase/lipase family protein [unclassified Coleofasciculus]
MDYYLSTNAVKLDPVNLHRYSQDSIQTASIDTEKTTVVFFGDSRASAWRKPKVSNFQFINRGISGETSAQAFLRFDYHVSYLQPDVIIVQVGINDLRMLPLPPKTRTDIVEACKDNIRRIAEKSQNLGATVIVSTIFPIGRGNLPLKERIRWQSIPNIEQDIEEVNTYVHSLKGDRIIVFDAYKILGINGKTKLNYTQDLLHINSAGYEALNREIADLLKPLHQ